MNFFDGSDSVDHFLEAVGGEAWRTDRSNESAQFVFGDSAINGFNNRGAGHCHFKHSDTTAITRAATAIAPSGSVKLGRYLHIMLSKHLSGVVSHWDWFAALRAKPP